MALLGLIHPETLTGPHECPYEDPDCTEREICRKCQMDGQI